MTADSLHVAAAAGIHLAAPQPELAHFFERWHEFYLLAGTAAVTLVGLLFVALSFNLEVLLHETKAHVLAHARATLLCFTYVLIVSLGFLAPFQNLRIISVLIIVTSTVVTSFQLRQWRRPRGTQPLPFERKMARRGVLFVIGYLIALLTGIAMLFLRAPELSFNLIGVICMLLGNAMGSSWDLLVEVGKLKAARTAAEKLAE